MLSFQNGRGLAVLGTVALGTWVAFGATSTPDATAQLGNGEFGLFQDSLVGWACVNGDHTEEWWVYFDGAYQWASPSHVGLDRWSLEAEYRGPNDWPSYDEWKANVLARPAAQGRSLTFQRHQVVEQSVQN